MEIDWFLLGIIVAIIVVLVSVYYWNSQLTEQEALASLELATVAEETKNELFDAQYNMHIFDNIAFPLHNEYDTLKAKNDTDGNTLKQTLMKRAVDCVVKAHITQQHGNAIAQLVQQNMAPSDTMSRIQSAIKKVEAEIKLVQLEAATLAPGWEKVIIQQAADMSINAQIKKQQEAMQAQQQAALQQQQQLANATTNVTQPTIAPTQQQQPQLPSQLIQQSQLTQPIVQSTAATTTPAKPTTTQSTTSSIKKPNIKSPNDQSTPVIQSIPKVSDEQAKQQSDAAFAELMAESKQNNTSAQKQQQSVSGHKKNKSSAQKSRKE